MLAPPPRDWLVLLSHHELSLAEEAPTAVPNGDPTTTGSQQSPVFM